MEVRSSSFDQPLCARRPLAGRRRLASALLFPPSIALSGWSSPHCALLRLLFMFAREDVPMLNCGWKWRLGEAGVGTGAGAGGATVSAPTTPILVNRRASASGSGFARSPTAMPISERAAVIAAPLEPKPETREGPRRKALAWSVM